MPLSAKVKRAEAVANAVGYRDPGAGIGDLFQGRLGDANRRDVGRIDHSEN